MLQIERLIKGTFCASIIFILLVFFIITNYRFVLTICNVKLVHITSEIYFARMTFIYIVLFFLLFIKQEFKLK
jgi:hypothetical protein